MTSEAKILQPIVRVASVCGRIDYELDLSNRQAIVLITNLANTKCVAFTCPQSLPSAVFPSIGYYITRFIS